MENGELTGDASRTFRLVTLGFLADGGDDYPFPDRDRQDLELEEEPRTGDAVAAADGTEQDALAEYLLDNFSQTPFDSEDVPPELDSRIQNLAVREDTVLSIEDINSGEEGGVTVNPDPVEDNDSDAAVEPLYGTTDAEEIEITGSNQDIFANDGDDLIDFSNSRGGNRLFAGRGNDTVILGEGDRVFTDDDDDRIFASSGGNNVITGNLGADQFWIANAQYPDSPNTITDFTSGEDVIGIAGLGIGFADLSITQTEAGALIAVEGNDIAIVGNTPDGFLAQEKHFVFV